MIFDQRIDKKLLSIVENARQYLPVNVERLAQNLGIVMKEVGDIEQGGHISIKDGVATITVNKIDSPTRKRFTIAHEIAHYLIHSSELAALGALDRDTNPLSIYTDKKETEANALAADILMPMDKIDALVQYGDIKTTADLASKLQVSEHALRIKLKIPAKS